MSNKRVTVTLEPLVAEDWDAFIRANQEAFNYGALEEFGQRHTFFEEEGRVTSRETVLMSLEHGRAYWPPGRLSKKPFQRRRSGRP